MHIFIVIERPGYNDSPGGPLKVACNSIMAERRKN